MPRNRRIVRKFALIHIIVRFLNRTHFLDSDQARGAYITRAARYFAKSDWHLLSYALMGTHVHFGAISGETPIADITQPLHNSFVHWLKARRDLLGPVVATRPTTKELPMEAAPVLIAYHHNNPVKAGLVARAKDSTWTSHRYYLDGAAPDWLDVESGLALSNLKNSAIDRKRFDRFVDASTGATLEDDEESQSALLRSARAALGSSIELGSPRITRAGALVADLFTPEDATLHPAWLGNLQLVVEAVAQETAVPAEAIRSRSRVRPIVKARRLFVITAHCELHRKIGHIGAAVGISSCAARRLERSATPAMREQAKKIASTIWRLARTRETPPE